MKVTECLTVEHAVFLLQLEHLKAAVDRGAAVEALQGMVAMLAGPLEAHAAAEDELLFPALEPHLGREAGPLAVMDGEHEEIRQSLSIIEQGGPEVVAQVKRLVHVLRHHIAKENQVLFPMAEQLLGSERLEELAQACPHQAALTRGGH